MPHYRMGEHVRVRARGLDYYGQIVAYGTSGTYWRYSVASFDELYYLHDLREKEIETIEGYPMPKVYNKNDRDIPEEAVYVGRPSTWGNPFKIGRDGTRAEVIAKYEALVHQSIYQNPDYLKPLRGKDLVCWCAPEPCHADVILRLANQTLRSFVVRSNQLSEGGFRVVLCKGNTLEDGTIWLTWTGNNIINLSTGQQERVKLCDQYPSMDALIAHLQTKNDVRCVYWRDTKEYQYINKQ